MMSMSIRAPGSFDSSALQSKKPLPFPESLPVSPTEQALLAEALHPAVSQCRASKRIPRRRFEWLMLTLSTGGYLD